MSDEEKVEYVDLTLAALDDPQCVYGLGVQVAAALKAFGTCTMIVFEDDSIRLMNHFNVFINAKAVFPPNGIEPKYIRPILTDKKPQFVAVKEDGSIWEVEYPDLVSPEEAGDTE